MKWMDAMWDHNPLCKKIHLRNYIFKHCQPQKCAMPAMPAMHLNVNAVKSDDFSDLKNGNVFGELIATSNVWQNGFGSWCMGSKKV